MSSYNHFGCEWCGGPFNGRNCPGFSSVGSGYEFVYDPNPYSYNETPNFFNQALQYQYETYSCELCGGSPHYGFDFQTWNLLIYKQDPCSNRNFSNDQSPYYSTSLPHQFHCCEVCGDTEESDDVSKVIFEEEKFSRQQCIAPIIHPPLAYTPPPPFLATMEPLGTLLTGDEDSSTNPARETDKFIKSSVDDLVSILREFKVTSDSNLECDMPVNTPLPTTDVREENFDINSPIGEHVVDFLMENEDIANLPRNLVKQLFSYLVKHPSSTKRMSAEPLGDDSKPRSYDVTFSNSLFDFNDDYTLCYDNLLFDDEFEDISSLDPLESTPVINESTFLVTPPPASKKFSSREVERFHPFFLPNILGFNPFLEIPSAESKGFAAALAILITERLKGDNTVSLWCSGKITRIMRRTLDIFLVFTLCELASIFWISVLMRFMDDLFYESRLDSAL
ncbi:hypothetical protein Tco_0693057 [Tanacetum coccineum]